jgi:penicillin-binding protein 1C
VLALANAYQMLAYRGIYRPASFHIGGLKARDSIYPANSTAIINDILTSSPNTPAYHTLITSDSWAIGSDAHYTMALWIAHNNNDDVLSTWLNIENELLQHTPSPAPKLPSKLIKRLIRFEPPIEAPRIELFLPDTDLSVINLPKAVSAMSALID